MKAILIDDEQLALDYLERQLKQVNGFRILGKFAYFDFKTHGHFVDEADIIFLDVDMPGMNGIDMAGKLLELKPALLIILVTAYNDYATEAFELQLFDYVTKPVQLDRLRKTCKRIEDKLQLSRGNETDLDAKLLVRTFKELTFEYRPGSAKRPKWRTRKAMELFLYLLQEQHRSVHKSELVDLLWSGSPPEKGFSQLYNSIYQVRRTLEPFSDHLRIISINESYTLELKDAEIDFIKWKTELANFPQLESHNAGKLEELLCLYTGPYLASHDFTWAETERFLLERLWSEHVQHLAYHFVATRQYTKAVKWLTMICKDDPANTEATVALLKSLVELGHVDQAKKHFIAHERAMEELDVQPHAEVAAIFERLHDNVPDGQEGC